MQYFLNKKIGKAEAKEKIKNADLAIMDLDWTIAEFSSLRALKTIYNFLKNDLENIIKGDYQILVHKEYPYVPDVLNQLKCKKIIITKCIPLFAKPIADILGFDEVYHGNHLPDSILASGQYKKIVFAGNSAKDEGIYKKLKEHEKAGKINYAFGIWQTFRKTINNNFEMNLFDKNWGPVLELIKN